MSTPEGKIKTFVDSQMKRWFPNTFKYSPPGLGRYGKNGMPDRLWFIKANEMVPIVVCIEVKAEGCKATPLQIKTLLDLKQCGCLVAVVAGKDQNKMNKIREEILRRINIINESII